MFFLCFFYDIFLILFFSLGMPIIITNVETSTAIFTLLFIIAVLFSFRSSPTGRGFLSREISDELKGFAILSIVFAHIAYILVSDNHFLYPLSIAAGLGVDIFLFLSGYGLTISMMKKPLSILEFYRSRFQKIFIPFWIVLSLLFLGSFFLLDIYYSWEYILQSFLGWFPHADAIGDINSPFWYLTWLLLFYLLFPLLFSTKRPWVTALLLGAIANGLVLWDPLDLSVLWLHRLHTIAFSLGIIFAWMLQKESFQSFFVRIQNIFFILPFRIGIFMFSLFAVWYLETHPFFGGEFLQSLLPVYDIGPMIAQINSISAMLFLFIAFALIPWRNIFLAEFGKYSYEIYLFHWPLLLHYDVFFPLFPAWLACIIWLVLFWVLGVLWENGMVYWKKMG